MFIFIFKFIRDNLNNLKLQNENTHKKKKCMTQP